MATHIALLRGVNVGGRKLLMADLRAAMTGLGYADVATYIQSGNVLFSAGAGGPSGSDELARELEAGLAGKLGWPVRLVMLSAAELAGVVSRNPYPDEPIPKYVHGVFLPADPGPEAAEWLAEAVRAAAGRGSRDEGTLIGRTLYLHTPDGFGRSELAKELMKRSSPSSSGTARNWPTITKLLSLARA